MNRKGFFRGRLLGTSLAVLVASMAWQQAGQAASDTSAAAPAASTAPADISKMSKEEIDTLIYERQQAMIQLEKDADLLGDIVAGLAPASKLAETTRSIADSAKESHTLFQMKIPGGRTKAEAWSNWADYSKRMDHFVTSTEAMAKVGATGNVQGVLGMLGDALQCKQCHEVYREPKKTT